MAECEFIVPGKPVGKARPRVTKAGHAYTPVKTVLYENWVKECFLDQVKDWTADDGEYQAVITAEFEIPKSKPKKKIAEMMQHIANPLGKPDLDNIAKVILDSLNGFAYKDDSHVTSLFIKKVYSDDPKVTVTIIKKE